MALVPSAAGGLLCRFLSSGRFRIQARGKGVASDASD
jgi:hypothetical protein